MMSPPPIPLSSQTTLDLRQCFRLSSSNKKMWNFPENIIEIHYPLIIIIKSNKSVKCRSCIFQFDLNLKKILSIVNTKEARVHMYVYHALKKSLNVCSNGQVNFCFLYFACQKVQKPFASSSSSTPLELTGELTVTNCVLTLCGNCSLSSSSPYHHHHYTPPH